MKVARTVLTGGKLCELPTYRNRPFDASLRSAILIGGLGSLSGAEAY